MVRIGPSLPMQFSVWRVVLLLNCSRLVRDDRGRVQVIVECVWIDTAAEGRDASKETAVRVEVLTAFPQTDIHETPTSATDE